MDIQFVPNALLIPPWSMVADPRTVPNFVVFPANIPRVPWRVGQPEVIHLCFSVHFAIKAAFVYDGIREDMYCPVINIVKAIAARTPYGYRKNAKRCPFPPVMKIRIQTVYHAHKVRDDPCGKLLFFGNRAVSHHITDENQPCVYSVMPIYVVTCPLRYHNPIK